MKTSLDAGESRVSNKLDKNIALHLKVLRKIYIYAFTLLNFWKFSEKIKNLVLRIPFSLSDPVFALHRRLKNPRTSCAQNVSSSYFRNEIRGKMSVGW